MTRKLTITYDRRDALFRFRDENEHGIHEFRCAYNSAHDVIFDALRVGANLAGLMDGKLTSITLEAP